MSTSTQETKHSVKLKVFARGLHHKSIFTYKIPSHQLMNFIIQSVNKIYDDVVTVDSCSCEEYWDNDEEFEKCINECYKKLSEIQERLVKKVLEFLEEMKAEVSEKFPDFRLEVYDHCDEYDACYVDVYLLCTWKGYVHDILHISFDFSIREADDLVYFDATIRTAIYTLQKPIHIDLIYKSEILLRLPLPDSPDKEEMIEIEI